MKFAATVSLAMGLAPLVLGKVALVQAPSRRDVNRAELERRNSGNSNKGNSNNNKGNSNNNVAAALAVGQLIGANSVLATQQQLLELEALQGLARQGVGAELIWINMGGGGQTTVLTQTVTQTVTQGGNAAAAAATPPGAAGTEAAAAGTVTSAASATAGAPPASASTHTVLVGGEAGKVFTPSSVNAAVGDTVEFRFKSVNHTVTQSGFLKPCVKMDGGMDTGFMANPNDTNPEPAVAMEVKVSTPLWFYCKAKGHCGTGMTLAVNPTADKTEALFQSMAIQQNGTGAATGITGGTTNTTATTGGGEAAAGASSASGAGSTDTSGTAGTGTGTTGGAEGSGTGSGLTTGTGTVQADGSCKCAVMCPLAGMPLPSAGVQGQDSFGGMGGSIPAANMMI